MTEAPKTYRVTLKAQHTHAGRPCAAGEIIEVTEPERDWLNQRGLISRRGFLKSVSTAPEPDTTEDR